VDLLSSSPETVRVDHLVLRPFDQGDIGKLAAAFEDAEIALWNPGPPGPRDEIAEWARRRNDWTAGDHASWAVGDSAGLLLGSVSLHHLDWDQRDAELGYWVAPWARRQRVGLRSVMLASDYGFSRLELRRVYLFHALENEASCRLAARAGFRLEGELLESHSYGDGRFHDEHLHARLASEGRHPDP
jgi:RimJ/RimL family protein N-acetyltransferase